MHIFNMRARWLEWALKRILDNQEMMLTYSFLMLIVYVKRLSLHNEISRVSLFVLHFHIVYSFKDLALHINIQHRGCNPLLHLQMVPMYEVVFLYFFLGFITL